MLKPKPIILDENTLILDTETTGLGSSAEICEISIIDGLGNVVFDSLIKPLNPIPEDVIKIHGITNEMVADAPSFSVVFTDMVNATYGKTIVIYNKHFDIKMLKQVANMAGISAVHFELMEKDGICAMRYYSEFKNQAKWSKLTDACINMGIDISQFQAHRALEDCKMTLELIRCMNDPNYIKTVKKKEEIMLAEKPQPLTTWQAEKGLLKELTFEITYTPYRINFNETEFTAQINEVIAPVKDLDVNVTKEVLAFTLANLRKFQKQISDKRISIVKDIKAPITEFEAKVKKGDAEIEQYISKYDANLKVILAKEKVTKHAEIEKLLPGIIEVNRLDKDYAAKLTILEDYYLVKWTIDKIILDLHKRAEELFKQQDYIRVQEELRNTQIESRTRLIEQLNAEYELNLTYASLPISHSDEMVRIHYAHTHQAVLFAAEQKAKEEAEKQIPVVAPEDETVMVSFLGGTGIVDKKEWNKAQAIIEQSKQTLEEAFTENGTPSERLVGIIPTGFIPTDERNIYQNLRLGASSQADILSAVAKLKAYGLSVEFI